jgi:hypothetical protein
MVGRLCAAENCNRASAREVVPDLTAHHVAVIAVNNPATYEYCDHKYQLEERGFLYRSYCGERPRRLADGFYRQSNRVSSVNPGRW